ncbi:MAG: EthD domain-containing protein [Acidimicrobiia bacterium]
MQKIVYCVRRNPSLSREEFLRYWLDEHGPLVRSLRESIPSMVRYVQSHTLEGVDGGGAARGAAEPYDGITEVWIDPSRNTGVDPAAAAEAGRKLFEDEAKFIDFANSSVFVTEEHEIF